MESEAVPAKDSEVEMAPTAKIPTIPEVFNGKKVLITGATGFVGKVNNSYCNLEVAHATEPF